MANYSQTPDTAQVARAARFVRGEATADRSATFRPAEEIAQRRDVLEAFRMSAAHDAGALSHEPATRALEGFCAALADEALGQVDRAHVALERFGAPDAVAEASLRWRLANHDEDVAAAGAALEKLFDVTDGAFRALVGLQSALMAWRDGAPAAQVLKAVQDATEGVEDALGGFSAVTAARLATDVLLEAGRSEQALEALEALLEHPRVARAERSAISAIYAVWASVFGQREKAVELLMRQSQKGMLHDDVERTLVHLLYELDRRADVFEVLARTTLARQRPELASSLAEHVREHDPEAAWETLRRAMRDFPEDDALVEFAAKLLVETRSFDDDFIDVLNRRLETPLTDARRVWTLCHLGRLYEERAEMEHAAAEVYREALTIAPGHQSATRALGRLFSRMGQWQALGELYEQEISVARGTISLWRLHFQAGEVFEHRVKNPKKALEHYRAVLGLKPSFLPALKGAARILESHQKWMALADLFLASVPQAPTRRQKLYLLDKVAEVAESHLENLDVAIGAWEEVLHLEPEHPTAYASLGRLYSRAQRWSELIRLNERELALIEDAEEAASMWVRNAEIAGAKLGDKVLSERCYRQALMLVPDFVPALEGLGRMLVRHERFGELIAMTERQIQASADENETWRRLGAIAELLEARSGQEAEAIELYERMHAMRPQDLHIGESLAVLYRRASRWRDLCDLLGQVVELVEPSERAAVHAEIGHVLEWRLEDPAHAFEHYALSLEFAPEQMHVLEGVARTWVASKVDPAVLADDLEDLSGRAREATCRSAYFLLVSRLRERSDGSPERSVTFRLHGDAEMFENNAVVRLARALGGQRKALREQRMLKPLTPAERIQDANLAAPDAATRKALIEVLAEMPADERRWVHACLPTSLVRGYVTAEDSAWDRLRGDMARVLDGDEPDFAPTSAGHFRLRAVEARLAGDVEQAISLTERELASVHSRELGILRCVELSRATQDDQWLVRATELAYPQDGDPIADGAVFERLRHALEEAQLHERMRFVLEVHVAHPAHSTARRAELYEQLGHLTAERFSDFDAAAMAYESSVLLVESREVRQALVETHERRGDLDSACEAQRKHFELTLNSDVGLDERHVSGLALAGLYKATDQAEAAIHLLEGLLHPAAETELFRKVQRELAHLHSEFGDLTRAAQILELLIARKPSQDDAPDWRRLVRLRREDFGDVVSAYGLQWKLVRALPGSPEDIEELFELAVELDQVHDCCQLLVAFARELKDERVRWTLIGRAAEALDEELHASDEAAKLYRELVEVTDGEQNLHYRRRLGFCLSRSVGREVESIRHFHALAQAEPFEMSNYQGLADLYERLQAYDRARLSRQMLRALHVPVAADDVRIKTVPSRAFESADVHHLLLPVSLRDGVWEVLQSAMPLAEKLWPDTLPQKKALDGEKVRDVRTLQILEQAFSMFGAKRVRAVASDSGPVVPFVFDDGTIWFNQDVLASAPEGQVRFLAGFAAALAYSGMPSLVAFDGRHVWHLIEGVKYRQTGEGFTDRIDVQSQEYADSVGGPFHTVARRRVQQALEHSRPLADAHCEAWPLELQRFACRVGLVACGEVESAIGAMLRIDGWVEPLSEDASQRRMRRSKEIEELVRFAFSDAYLEARYRLGLGGRPTILGQ